MSNADKTVEVLLKLNDQMAKQLSVTTDAMKRANDMMDKMNAKNNAVDLSSKKVSSSFGSLAIKLGAMVTAYASVHSAVNAYESAITSIISTGSQFEQTMANTRAILQPTEAEFNALSKSAQELGRTTVFTASEAGNAYTELGKLGFDSSQILAAGNDTLVLAAATNLDLASAASAAATVIRQFNLDASETGKVADIMAKSFSISALDAEKFTGAMRYVGPAANAAGIDLSETTAAIATLTDAGMQGTQSGTALRRIIMELSNEGSKASKIIEKINPNAKTLAEKFEALKKAGIDNASATKLFRMEASTAALVLASSSDKVADYANQLLYAEGAAKGFAQKVADVQLDTFQGDVKLATSALEGIQISFFEAFGESSRRAIQGVTERLHRLSTWIEENPDKLREWGKTAEGIFNLAAASAEKVLTVAGALNTALGKIVPQKIEFDPANLLIESTDEMTSLAKIMDEQKENGNYDDATGTAYNKAKNSMREYRKEVEELIKNEKALKNLDEVKRLEEIYSATEKAILEEKKYKDVVNETALKKAEELKKEQKGKKLKKGVVDDVSSESIDVQAMKDEETAAKEAAKKAEAQWEKLYREKELSGLDSQRRSLKEIEYFWDDAIELDKAGGAKHIKELTELREEAISEFLKIDFEIPQSTFEGRGIATSYDPSSIKTTETGGQSAADSSALAKEAADNAYNERKRSAELLERETKEARKSDYELEMENYNSKLALLEEFNLSTEELTAEHNERMKQMDIARLQAAGNLAGGLSALMYATADDNKKALAMYKVLATSQAIMDTYAAANAAFLAGGGWPVGAIDAAASVAYGLANVAMINGIHFAKGTKSTDASFGLVPGNSYYGDKVQANLNSGEMVLSRNEAQRYKEEVSNNSSMTINYSPTYGTDVSALQKRSDYREFRRMMKTVSNDRSFGRSQASIL